MRYSPSTGTFYPESIHYPNLPEDLVEVSEADYARAMTRLADHDLVVRDNGSVTLIQVRQTPAQEKAAVSIRIDAHASALLTEGGFKVGEAWFPSDTRFLTRLHLLSALTDSDLVDLAAEVQPLGGGPAVTVTRQWLSEAILASLRQEQAIFSAARQNKIALAASGNPKGFNYRSGWPAAHKDVEA